MHRLPASLLALITTALPLDTTSTCRTSSLPNPIASQYYANITGTINGTLAVLPIPYSMARRIVPAQYEILSDQYRTIMPELPRDMYPALLQAVFDHDIRYMDYKMPDFSVCSSSSSNSYVSATHNHVARKHRVSVRTLLRRRRHAVPISPRHVHDVDE